MRKLYVVLLLVVVIIGVFVFIRNSKAPVFLGQDIESLDGRNGRIVECNPHPLAIDYVRKVRENNLFDPDALEILKIRYLSDGLEVVGFIIKPEGDGPIPVIIYNRGGNRDYGMITDAMLPTLCRWASKGFVVVASQYRGNDGGEGREEFGGKDVNDVLNLIPLIKSLPFTDPEKIGMLGVSRGGMMTYIAIKRDIPIKAAIVLAGPTDLLRPDELNLNARELIGGDTVKARDQYIERSALYWPEEINVPVLILHGTLDSRVNVEESLLLAEKLDELKKPYKLITYPDEHGLRHHSEEYFHETIEWFNTHLGISRKGDGSKN